MSQELNQDIKKNGDSENKITEIESHMSKAIKFERQGKHNEAIFFYTKALELDGGENSWKLYLKLGIAYRAKKSPIRAILELKKAYLINPSSLLIIENLALAYLEAKKMTDANAIAESNLSNNPNSNILNMVLGTCHAHKEEYTAAAKYFEHSLLINPNTILSIESMGLLCIKTGKYTEAIDYCNQWIRLEPNNSNAYSQRSKALTLQGNHKEALIDIEAALSLEPSNHLHQAERTRLNFILGGYDGIRLDRNEKLPWNQRDDFFLQSNGAKAIVISFAGNGRNVEDGVQFNFFKLFEPYDYFDKLYLRDISRNYYLNGLPRSSNSLEKTIKLIDNICRMGNYERIIAVGVSAGGFASILYGHLLSFDKVIAFNPQTVINEKQITEVNDHIFHKPERLNNLKNNKSCIKKYLDLKNLVPFNTQADIYYSEQSLGGVDKRHAMRLEHKNCKLIMQNSYSHLLALEMKDQGKLLEIILSEV